MLSLLTAADGEAGNGKLDGSGRQPPIFQGRRNSHGGSQATQILGIEVSGQLRDRLLGKVRELGSCDGAVTWAHKHFADKYELTVADALSVKRLSD